ncbi:MAG: DNA polymerase III subunit delta [Chloroflexi bacterium]|nr:DNA polymerase III subunit delta [Chloroflexota bacterium]
MFYILHGDDEFSRSEALDELKHKMGDATMADLNTSVLDGRKLSLPDLIYACDSMPFLSERRLVIVDGLLTHLGRKRKGNIEDEANTPSEAPSQERPADDFTKKLLDYLSHLPDTTRLVLIEREKLPARHPVLAYAQNNRNAYVKEYLLPVRARLTHWIQTQAKTKGGQIQPDAAELLGAYIGNDLRLLDQELEKLLMHSYPDARITAAEVRLLVPYVRESNIFEMVDALCARNGHMATRLLHGLIEDGESPQYLLTMIARQFRILIQMKELSQQGLPAESIRSQLGLHPFVVEKGLAQTRQFTLDQLLQIHHRLLELDVSIKTGHTEAVLALDLLVGGLTGQR